MAVPIVTISRQSDELLMRGVRCRRYRFRRVPELVGGPTGSGHSQPGGGISSSSATSPVEEQGTGRRPATGNGRRSVPVTPSGGPTFTGGCNSPFCRDIPRRASTIARRLESDHSVRTTNTSIIAGR